VGDVPHSQADIAVARESFDYHPVVSFHEGIARTVAWYLGQGTGQAEPIDRSAGAGA
jgi:nucleoside-diphosphate-sugar epimerase